MRMTVDIAPKVTVEQNAIAVSRPIALAHTADFSLLLDIK